MEILYITLTFLCTVTLVNAQWNSNTFANLKVSSVAGSGVTFVSTN
jgi:hypothetical protein